MPRDYDYPTNWNNKRKTPEGWELDALIRKRSIISQVPMKNVEFVVGHQIQMILQDVERKEMSWRVQHKTPVWKAREISYRRQIYLELERDLK